MKTMTMPDLHTRSGKTRILILGGWKLRIPQITDVDQQTKTVYGRYFVSTKGFPPMVAEAETIARLQSLLHGAWFRMQALAIRRWAKLYYKRFPEKLGSDGILKGFNPERMQDLYVPGVNTGRRGKAYAATVLGEFARGEPV